MDWAGAQGQKRLSFFKGEQDWGSPQRINESPGTEDEGNQPMVRNTLLLSWGTVAEKREFKAWGQIIRQTLGNDYPWRERPPHFVDIPMDGLLEGRQAGNPAVESNSHCGT